MTDIYGDDLDWDDDEDETVVIYTFGRRPMIKIVRFMGVEIRRLFTYYVELDWFYTSELSGHGTWGDVDLGGGG